MCLQRIFLVVVLLVSLSACKEDECKGKKYYPTDPRVIEAIPYVDKQLVAFRTNRGDDFHAGVKRVFEVEHSKYMCDEGFYVILNRGDKLPYMQIDYRASFFDKPVIQITFAPNRDNISYIVQILLLDNEKMEAYLPGPYRKSIFHDTVTIEGLAYKNVVEIIDDTPSWKGIIHMFYNKNFGVIQFKTGDGLVVTRQ